MSIKIQIPSYLQPFINNTEAIEVNGSTVGECLNHLVEQFPDINDKLFDKSGKLYSYVAIYINGEDAYPEELARSVKDRAELQIFYIIDGG
ncbi:MoaD/ThiS family protein [Chloroflexota bacterium]